MSRDFRVLIRVDGNVFVRPVCRREEVNGLLHTRILCWAADVKSTLIYQSHKNVSV